MKNPKYPGRQPKVVVWDGSQAAINDREGCARICLETRSKTWGPCIGFNYPDFNSDSPNRTSWECSTEHGDIMKQLVNSEWHQYYMLVDRNPVCIDIGNLIFKFDITKLRPLKHAWTIYMYNYPNIYRILGMQGYRCGFEKDDCKCSGSVAFGIPGTANIGNFNGTFTGSNEDKFGNFTFGNFTNDDFKLTGTWSELKRDVKGSINCVVEDFVGYETDCDQKPFNKPCESKKECRCFPDSKLLFFLN